MSSNLYDVIILGAGAAGLFCAGEAARRGRRVLVIDHAKKPAEKVRISGGGRCNFTNMDVTAANFLSANPHFCKSALKRFTQWDFIERVSTRGIAWHEKTRGQLFCDGSSKEIIDMLLDDIREGGVTLKLATTTGEIEKQADGFVIATSDGACQAASLIVATGGLSIPKMGASGLAYDIARQFGLNIIPPEPALVPFVFDEPELAPIKALAGVAVETEVRCGKTRFDEALLFTHRGLSGPAVLQISSFWDDGAEVSVNLAAGQQVRDKLKEGRQANPRQILPNALASILPKRLAQAIADDTYGDARLADLSDVKLGDIADRVQDWRIIPDGTEGYRTAEVTRGGVDTHDLSSRTMEARDVPGLYFIGEAVDVTGWLGGYNFQWAWSSAWAAGQVV